MAKEYAQYEYEPYAWWLTRGGTYENAIRWLKNCRRVCLRLLGN
jgi:hypothetical protein